MPASVPQRSRVYRCHHLDSMRWDDIVPRRDDIVIADDLVLYEAAAARALTPDLTRWLDRGAASGVVPK